MIKLTDKVYIKADANNYTLTVNPNGGSYGGSTSNTTYSQKFNTVKNMGTATPPGAATITYNGNGGTSASASATVSVTAPAGATVNITCNGDSLSSGGTATFEDGSNNIVVIVGDSTGSNTYRVTVTYES
jgi:hypothetical protein